MTIAMSLWVVEKNQLRTVPKSRLNLESELETWLEKDSGLLGTEMLVIGRQVRTAFGGLIDLLGLDREGDLVIVELKRNKTPRDVVAQCLDYASWISDLGYEDIAAIHDKNSATTLSDAFENFYGALLPETINDNHQILIVAAEMDEATARIIEYLTDKHSVNINAVFFNAFERNGEVLIGRSYLQSPDVIEERSSSGRRAPWTGYYFVNTGIADNNPRDWALNQKYHYISAGGGPRWINAIKKLRPGDKIFAYVNGTGYVGYGVVEESAVPVTEFEVGGQRFVNELPGDHRWRQQEVTDDKGEWLVKVNWLSTVPADQAKWIKNGFANQNVVCKLRDPRTFEFLKREFDVEDE